MVEYTFLAQVKGRDELDAKCNLFQMACDDFGRSSFRNITILSNAKRHSFHPYFDDQFNDGDAYYVAQGVIDMRDSFVVSHTTTSRLNSAVKEEIGGFDSPPSVVSKGSGGAKCKALISDEFPEDKPNHEIQYELRRQAESNVGDIASYVDIFEAPVQTGTSTWTMEVEFWVPASTITKHLNSSTLSRAVSVRSPQWEEMEPY